MEERLQKIIAQSGVSSRRAAEALIRDGRVTVNGKVVRELGTKADPEKDDVRVDNASVSLLAGPRIVIMVHKPAKVIVTANDPQGRQTIMTLLDKRAYRNEGPRKVPRVFPIGRLDYDSEGLILMTNDGDLSERLVHPRFHVPKIYLVKVTGVVEEKGLKRIRQGIHLKEADGRVVRSLPAQIDLHRRTDKHAWYAVTIFEGRNRLLKRLFQAVGHPVRRILRIDFGGLPLGDLPEGEWRQLSEDEERLLDGWMDDETRNKRLAKAKTYGGGRSEKKRPPGRQQRQGS